MNTIIINNQKEPIILPVEGYINITVEKGAQATVHDLDQISERIIFITLCNDAQLDYIFSRTTNNTRTTVTITQQQSSSFNFFAAIYVETNLNISVQLQAPGAEAHIAGFYNIDREKQCIITTEQLHQAPNTRSNVLFNGVLFDCAQSRYHGTIAIQELARQSKAIQKNKNLLFGEHARAISVPNMEVKTNDVQCNHGSAVGRLNEEQLFYMQSRGLEIEHARHLLVDAFLHEVMAAVPNQLAMALKGFR
jgi:Fe-S cluster assembly protein SufD